MGAPSDQGDAVLKLQWRLQTRWAADRPWFGLMPQAPRAQPAHNRRTHAMSPGQIVLSAMSSRYAGYTCRCCAADAVVEPDLTRKPRSMWRTAASACVHLKFNTALNCCPLSCILIPREQVVALLAGVRNLASYLGINSLGEGHHCLEAAGHKVVPV
jgi:hypothetical protein